MNKFQLFRTLRKHIKLSEKRSVAYEQNKVAKLFLYIGGAFVIVYMVFIAILLALAANTSTSNTPYEIFFGLAPLLLTVDFLFRFISQQTPKQLIKPYSLLPIPKYTCVELFILSSVVTPNNLIWMAITVPYVIMTTLFNGGIMAAVGIVVSFQILVVINSQWYMLVRTLLNKSLLWWLLPTAVYAAIYSPVYLDDFTAMLVFYAQTGEGFTFWHPLSYLAILLVLTVFIEINKRVQYRLTYLENTGAETKKMKTVSEFKMFDRYGEVGEYLKLEVKSLMRNKNMRKSFIFSSVFIIILSLVISFTDIYDNSFFNAFWLVYVYVLYGGIMLLKIMSAEGNYIDCLMIHKENITSLLKAKYYFHSLLSLLPMLLMLPTVFMGKYSLLALFSMLCFTIGPVYCLLMQNAVYNRQTMPLNTKFISKGSIENNYFQIIAELVAMTCPIIVIMLLKSVLSETMTFVVVLAIGITFIATHDLWIRNIYKRFMKRRYKNMESLRATR